MSELRGLPRWSKTAVVIVLVVFFLVLAVSIFGLWALANSREAAEARARSDALQQAGKKLQKLRDSVRETLSLDLTNYARECDSGSALKRIIERPGGSLISGAFEVDERGAVRWIDGDVRLWLPPERFAKRTAPDQADSETSAAREDAAAADAAGTQGPDAALKKWMAVTEWYPLVTSQEEGEPKRYPLAVKYATQMLRVTNEATGRGGGPDVADLRRALRRAIEVETLNAGRKDIRAGDLTAALTELGKQIDEMLAPLPTTGQEYAAWEVQALRDLRDELRDDAGFRQRIDSVVATLRMGMDASPVVEAGDEEILAAVPRGDEGRVVVFRMHPDRVAETIAQHAKQMGFEGLGMDVKLVPDGARMPDEMVIARSESMASAGGWQLPYRVLLQQVRDPSKAPDETTNWFYWGIIGLAIAGIGIGGYVLLRLLTREMRLAQLKADFVSNLSHELKTPITSISLFAEMLQDGKIKTPDDQTEAYSVIAGESERLQRIVSRMIEVARRAGGFEPGKKLTAGDLNVPVREATTRFRRIVSEPGVHLHIALGPSPLLMRMDQDALNDVVTNLLANAWKYRRGEEANIHVTTAVRGRRIELLVEDDGIGIPKGERRRVFEMFYRAEQLLTQPVAGTGLGLALVRTIVRTHGGSIAIESGRGGRGTRFRLRFPHVTRMSVALPSPDPATLDSVHNVPPHARSTAEGESVS